VLLLGRSRRNLARFLETAGEPNCRRRFQTNGDVAYARGPAQTPMFTSFGSLVVAQMGRLDQTVTSILVSA
jgi:hypothetical protein